MSKTLRDGSTVEDHRLDRIPEYDERNESFLVRGALRPASQWVRVRWTVPHVLRLDQGQEGACVGFSQIQSLEGPPSRYRPGSNELGVAEARKVYHLARTLDSFPDEDGEGTSVLAGCKAGVQLGHIRKYLWCRSIQDVIQSIQSVGPIVYGTYWHKDMFDPDDHGVLHVSGDIVGGHAYMLDGYTPNLSIMGKQYGPALTVQNSWGTSWGREGRAFLLVADAKRLLQDEGEAVALIGTGK